MSLYAEAHQFFDGNGKQVPALDALELKRYRSAPFLLYVPNTQVLGGTIGLLATLPLGTECGHLFEATPRRCIAGVGDLYVEAAWSRFYGTVRSSSYHDAYPIAEGLSIYLGVGVIVPIGKYSAADAAVQGLTLGCEWRRCPAWASSAKSLRAWSPTTGHPIA